MKKLFLLFGFILLFSVFVFGQKTERVIDYRPNQPAINMKGEPNIFLQKTDEKGVELVEFTVDGKSVAIGESFTAGDDWLKTLTVKLKNVSGKPITSARMSFGRPEAKFKDSSLGFSLAFGSLGLMTADRQPKIILPGEVFELKQDENTYNSEKAFMIEKTGVSNITKIIIGMTLVQFDDGYLWTTSKMPSAE